MQLLWPFAMQSAVIFFVCPATCTLFFFLALWSITRLLHEACPITELVRNVGNQKWIQIFLQTCSYHNKLLGAVVQRDY